MDKNLEQVSDFTKISSTVKLEKTTALGVGRELGEGIKVIDPDNSKKKEFIERDKIKERILGKAKRGQSIRQFVDETVKNEMGVKGTEKATAFRKKLKNFLKRIFGKTSSDEYYGMKEEKNRIEAARRAQMEQYYFDQERARRAEEEEEARKRWLASRKTVTSDDYAEEKRESDNMNT